jgi:hypothetical protein
MNITSQSAKTCLLSAFIGAVITFGVMTFTSDETTQRQQISLLEARVGGLETLLSQKEEELKNAHFFPPTAFSSSRLTTVAKTNNKATDPMDGVQPERLGQNTNEVAAPRVDYDQQLKDLMTLFVGDSRTFSEKVNELIASDPSKENIAIASAGIYNLADNRDVLPDHSLQSLYEEQANKDLKRVVAQVASMRGDNSLIEMQITEVQASLKSENPADRQKALVELAKTRYAGAANVIVPLLQDDDIGVKLDALLALRATGNQSHIRLVEGMVNDPNDSVSWLANDVINNLQNLSERARTRIASNDIVAELPPMTIQ